MRRKQRWVLYQAEGSQPIVVDGPPLRTGHSLAVYSEAEIYRRLRAANFSDVFDRAFPQPEQIGEEKDK